MSSSPLWQELSRIAGWPLRAPVRRPRFGALARDEAAAWSDTLPQARFLDEPAPAAPIERLGAPRVTVRRLLTL